MQLSLGEADPNASPEPAGPPEPHAPPELIACPDPTTPSQPPPFARWLTVVATLAIAANFAEGLRRRHATGINSSAIEPLVFFDARMRHESIDRAPSQPIAEEAERLLRTAIADRKQPVKVVRGARARLAVVLGDRGLWSQAQPELVTDEDGAAFSRVVNCAYGPDRQICGKPSACDEETAHTAMTVYAGEWAAGRACFAAARRIGATGTVTRLQAVQSRASRSSFLVWVSNGGAFVAGVLAAGLLLRARRGRLSPPLLPAPWPLGDLYAALVRCALWTLILAPFISGIMLSVAHVPIRASMDITFYVVGLWWVVRLVFRRWGLSWRDSLTWPRGGMSAKDVALTLVAAIGFERGGRMAIALAGGVLGRRLPWSDILRTVDPASNLELAASAISLVVLPALIEELVFRRLIFSSLRQKFAPTTAALASTTLFALAHGYSLGGLFVVFWLGLVATWAFNRTGNLWPSVATHAFANAVALLSNLI